MKYPNDINKIINYIINIGINMKKIISNNMENLWTIQKYNCLKNDEYNYLNTDKTHYIKHKINSNISGIILSRYMSIVLYMDILWLNLYDNWQNAIFLIVALQNL